MKLKVSGHRGSGASDAPFNRQRDTEAGIIRLDENTIPSHLAVLNNGADGSETDLIETGDENIGLVHANDYSQHILAEHHNETTSHKKFIGQLTTQEMTDELHIGIHPRSRIPTLGSFLTAVKELFPAAFLNLELKGVQDTRPDYQTSSHSRPSLAEKALRIIQGIQFPLDQIRFSSFAISYLKDMMSANPQAELGMLFDLPQDQGGDAGLPMFKDRRDVYLPFTVEAMEDVLSQVPTLKAVHPEVQSLDHRNVGFAARQGLTIATWGWKEYSPLGDLEGNQRFARAITNAFNLCNEHGVKELTIITDHVVDMRIFLSTLNFR